jgi:hypothetical protein
MPRLISPAVMSAPENVNFCLAAIQLFANVFELFILPLYLLPSMLTPSNVTF